MNVSHRSQLSKTMPYADGHIYRTTTAGVSISDVGRALGVGSRDLGTLCRHANINRWAKWKPEAKNQIGSLTRAQRITNKYGFQIPYQTADRPNNLLTYYGQADNGWQYIQRNGYYRLLDFSCPDVLSRGYLVEAQSPIAQYTPAVSVLYDDGTTFNIAAMIATQNTDEEIGLDDIAAALGETALYFGVCIFKGTDLNSTSALSARFELATATVPISRNGDAYSGTSLNFSKTGMSSADAGDWTIVPFLSNTYIAQCGSWGGAASAHTFYPLPVISPSVLTIASREDLYTVNFTGLKQTLTLEGTVKIANNTASALSLDVMVWIWDSSVPGNPDTRAMLSYEIERNKGSKSIPANSTLQVDSFSLIKGRDVTQQLYDYAVAYVRVGTDLKGPFSFLRIND